MESVEFPEKVLIGLAVCSHDNSTLGTATFDQVNIEKTLPEKPVTGATGSGNGLQVSYFNSLTGQILSRTDKNIDFDWDIDAPAEGIGPDFFSARWEGYIEAPSDDLYAFHLLSDDGARLWLDGQLLIDSWMDRGLTQDTAKVQLKAGRRYSIQMDNFERTGEAIVKLLWSTPTLNW